MDAKLQLWWSAVAMGAPFLWFIAMARRTFVVPESGAFGIMLGGVSMFSGVALTLWEGRLGTYEPILWDVGALLALCSIVLYEAARRVVTGRGFCSVLSGEVPPQVCAAGPYRYVRHPVYTSYMLAFLALLIAFPGWPTAVVFTANLAFYVYAAADEERTIAQSALGEGYASYRRGTGMFLPRLRHANGSPPPS
jgi:protein-S-isoprenylcysteine O-methyltransferase Ste14